MYVYNARYGSIMCIVQLYIPIHNPTVFVSRLHEEQEYGYGYVWENPNGIDSTVFYVVLKEN